jgi:hypothetical protein
MNYTSVVSRNLVPLSDDEPHKDINEKLHNNFMHLSKMCDLFSQIESSRDISKSENISYLSNRKDTFHSETRSERVHMKTKLSVIDSSKYVVSKGCASRHNSRRDEYEYKSYSKDKHSENSRSITHSRNVSSGHHPQRNESCKTQSAICEGSVSHALRDEGFVSYSKTVSRSEQNIGKVKYNVRASSHTRSLLSGISEKLTDHALKVAGSGPSTYCVLKHSYKQKHNFKFQGISVIKHKRNVYMPENPIQLLYRHCVVSSLYSYHQRSERNFTVATRYLLCKIGNERRKLTRSQNNKFSLQL